MIAPHFLIPTESGLVTRTRQHTIKDSFGALKAIKLVREYWYATGMKGQRFATLTETMTCLDAGVVESMGKGAKITTLYNGGGSEF